MSTLTTRRSVSADSNLLVPELENETHSAPDLLVEGEHLQSTDSDRAAGDDEQAVDMPRAARRLYRAVSTSAVRNQCSAERTIRLLLERAQKTDELLPEDVLETLQLEEFQDADSAIVQDTDDAHDQTEGSPIFCAPVSLSDGVRLDDAMESQLDRIARLLSVRSSAGWDELTTLLERGLTRGHVDALVDYVLGKLQEQGNLLLHQLFPYSHIQTMLFVCLVQIITLQRLLDYLPVVACYLSFGTMIYYTLRMFQTRTVLREMELWRKLFHAVDQAKPALKSARSTHTSLLSNASASASTPSLDVPSGRMSSRDPSATRGAGARSTVVKRRGLYDWQSMDPYVSFFTALVVFVLSFAMCGKTLPNCLFLSSLSLLFCLLSFVALKHHWLALAALSLDVVSLLPAIIRKFELHRSNVLFMFCCKEWTWYSAGNLQMQLSLPALAFVMIVMLYAGVVLFGSEVHAHQIVIQQLVCLFWWQAAIMLLMAGHFEVDEWSIVLTVGIVSLVLFPTAVGMALVVGLVIAQLKSSLNYWNVLKGGVTLFILFLPFFYRKVQKWLKNRLPGEQNKKRFALICFYIFLVFMSITLLYHGTFAVDREVSNLTWQAFDRHCGGTPQMDDNMIARQKACTHLKSRVVGWKGIVQTVRIYQIENTLDNLLDYLPNTLAEWMRCFYGKAAAPSDNFLVALNVAPQSCSVAKHNVYTYEIEVAGPWGESVISSAKSSVLLIAANKFAAMVEQLHEGDVVSFTALFDEAKIKYPPRLKLLQLQCISCRKLESDPAGAPDTVHLYAGFWSQLFHAFKFFFNFLFAPFFRIL